MSGSQPQPGARPPERSSGSEWLARAAHLVSPRLGPLVEVLRPRVQADFAFLQVAVTKGRAAAPPEDTLCTAGGGLTWRRALSAALGEAIERLCILRPLPRRTFVARYGELRGRAIPPSRFLFYPEEMYRHPSIPIEPCSDEMPLEWARGHVLPDLEPIQLPAFAVYAQPGLREPGVPFPDRPLSTGAACAPTLTEATLAGLYEVIERDAFSIHWENRWPGRPLRPPPSASTFEQGLHQAGFELRLARLETDIAVPVVVAAVVDKAGERAAIALGAAARWSEEAAAFRAIEEAVLTSFWMTQQQWQAPVGPERLLGMMQGLASPECHARLHAHPEFAPRALFLLGEPGRSPDTPAASPEPPAREALASIVARLRHAGLRPIVVELTGEAACFLGLWVVRVIVPGMVPLGRGFHARPLRNARLRTVPERLGFPSLAGSGFNPDPHPFP